MFHMTSWKKRCERILLILVNERIELKKTFVPLLSSSTFLGLYFKILSTAKIWIIQDFFSAFLLISQNMCQNILKTYNMCYYSTPWIIHLFFCQELSLSFFNLCPKMSSYSSVKKSNFLLTFHSVSHKSRYAYFRRGS